MPDNLQIIASVLFALAVLHTFCVKFFENLAHRRPQHSGLFHLLGEIEVVFGFWAMVLMLCMFFMLGKTQAIAYIDSRNFTEPMFVFAIMVVAASKPILRAVTTLVEQLSKLFPFAQTISFYFLLMSLVPLLGSLITEPAAMTLAALLLRDYYYKHSLSNSLKYATLGVLFVNISIGGVLTPFAAPPVLIVAGQWGWDLMFMLTHFGWKATIAVLINALAVTLIFAKELKNIAIKGTDKKNNAPPLVVAIHLLFLIGIIFFAHHPAVFMSLLLFFLGFAHAYQRYQDRLILREGLLVAFFLAGLIVLGGQQAWWLQPLLSDMHPNTVFFGATILTAITDNAALTYLGSLVPNTSDAFKYALVAGAVAGGGLTVIANAPNPAGFTILRDRFVDGTINPFRLLLAAILPTIVALLAFKFL